jgi:hypothetical protein
MFCKFHHSHTNLRVHLEIKCLSGCLTIRDDISVPIFIALFYILHFASHNGIYFHLEYHGVEPKNEGMSPFWPPFIHPSTSDLWPVCRPNQACLVVWKVLKMLLALKSTAVSQFPHCRINQNFAPWSLIVHLPIHSSCQYHDVKGQIWKTIGVVVLPRPSWKSYNNVSFVHNIYVHQSLEKASQIASRFTILSCVTEY